MLAHSLTRLLARYDSQRFEIKEREHHVRACVCMRVEKLSARETGGKEIRGEEGEYGGRMDV